MKATLFVIVALLASVMPLSAQTCNPTASFTYLKDNEPQVEEDIKMTVGASGEETRTFSAPASGVFKANPPEVEGYKPIYAWRIVSSANPLAPVIRNGENYPEIEYTFTQSGSYTISLKVTFVNDELGLSFDDPDPGEYTISLNVSASRLEMPNAFSPNGDGYNDIYKAKSTHQSIVSFKATIFNRWGQKLYSWNDVNGGWDGKVNGKTVKDGVYYVNVVAKGADGFEYKIRKDVNVLTGYDREEGSTTNP